MMQAWSSFLGGSPLPLLGAADAPPLPQSSTIDKPGRD
jgi:hypothetical protein